jgi:hypothetical protein
MIIVSLAGLISFFMGIGENEYVKILMGGGDMKVIGNALKGLVDQLGLSLLLFMVSLIGLTLPSRK